MNLAGRTALITSATLGLGAAIAEQFAAAGASLMLCARNATELEAQRTRLARRADVAHRTDIDALFGAAVDAFAKLDIPVNNAGVYGPMGTIETVDWDEWINAITINLMGTVYCSRKAIERFKPNRYGKIVNLSGGGATNPLPGISAYAASKAAVMRLTETLALEVKDNGIDVNAVAPGALATRLTEQLLAAGPEQIGAALVERMVPADRGEPWDKT
jgi:3-oxoacyl-[acyl-carrier protein] reductase